MYLSLICLQLLLTILYAPALIRDYRARRLKQKRQAKAKLPKEEKKQNIVGKSVSHLRQPTPTTATAEKPLALTKNNPTFAQVPDTRN